jgi:putative drug exporter of the RND superfamily
VIRRVATWPCGRRTKWFVLAFWVLLLVVAGPLAGKLNSAQKNDTSAWLPKNAESTKVLNASAKFRPNDTLPALVVYDRGGTAITPADQAKAAGDAQRFASVKYVTGKVIGPVSAKDGQALQTIVNVKLPSSGWSGLTPVADQLRSIAKSGAGGLAVHVTGPIGYAADSGKVFSGSDGKLLYITLAVVIGILLLTYRSPLLWLLPILSAGVALGASQALIYLLAKHGGLTVNAQSSFILTVLVLGAGTDYALLLIARYREELRTHEDRHEAMAEALHRAGPAIVASAATVAVSLLCLLAAELNSTKGLGPVCAIGVGVGLLAMTTLLPALLVIFGRWMFWPKRPAYGSAEPTEGGLWARVGTRLARRPRMSWLVTAVVLGILATGTLGFKADGLQQKDGFWSKPESVTGQAILGEHFPAGSGTPLVVVGNASAADRVHTALTGTPGVTGTTTPQIRDGDFYLEGTLNAAPDSQPAYDIVKAMRAKVHAIGGADAKVGGGSAVNLDVADASAHDRNLIIPLVLGVVFVILGLLLRSLIAPLLLIGTVVLSFGATLGVSAMVFNHLFHFAGADNSLPLWVFVFLVALGIDYNIFLMSRVHEEARQFGTRRGALIGLAATGGVITSAGAVLAGTFSALGSLPLVFITEIGFAVAFGVLMDTIVVRSVLVTALTLDVDRWMWWPSKLSRRRSPEPPKEEEGLQPALSG